MTISGRASGLPFGENASVSRGDGAAGQGWSLVDVRARFAPYLPLVLVGLAAIAIRAWIVAGPAIGNEWDLEIFVRWVRGLNEHGLRGFYEAESFCDYPPLTLLLLQLVGLSAEALTGDPSTKALQIAIKCLPCVADLVIGALLFIEGRRLFGTRAGSVASGLYLLNPVSIYDSAYWGQVDAVYAVFLLGAFLLVGRQRWGACGFVAALSLAAKFQAVSILPLVLFEVCRRGGGRGFLRASAGGAVALALVATPFLATGNLTEAVSRSYIDVVGQYESMSHNAYNLWFLAGDPSLSDTTPPSVVVRAASRGRDVVGVDASWLLGFDMRRISLILYALAVAVILSIYALRPGPVTRYGAAGLLALAFYLFPTEMHERYAFSAIALLVPWAVAQARNERIYWALSIAILLNLVAVLPVRPLAPQIAAANLVIFGLILAGLSFAPKLPSESEKRVPVETPTRRPRFVRGFQLGTLALGTVVGGLALIVIAMGTRGASAEAPGDVWLDQCVPISAEQGWRELTQGRSVAGGPLTLGDQIYLRGIGTHAPAVIEYAVPAGSRTFEAIAGLDQAGGIRGSAVLTIEVDGSQLYESPVLTAGKDPIPVRVPVAGASVLSIRVASAGDGPHSDHVDLVMARFVNR